MQKYAFAVPILPGQEAANRQFAAELTGPRRADFEASRQRMGIRGERVWTQATPQGTMSVVYLEADDLGRAFTELATSQDRFDVWWRQQILAMHGIDFSQPLPGPPNELILEFSNS
jgi:hypothetical protein